MPAKKSAPEYLVITSAKNKGIFGARVLSRGEPFLPVDVCVGNKRLAPPAVGDLVLCDMTDADSGVGTADILEFVTDAKEIKKLRKDGTLPAEEDYAEFVFKKEHYGDKKEKLKGAAKTVTEAGEEAAGSGNADEDAGEEEESEDAAVARPSREKKAKMGKNSKVVSPALDPSANGPIAGASKFSLEQQMEKLDAREGNAELDNI